MYRNKLRTAISYVPQQVTYRNKLRTATSYVPQQVTYRNKLYTAISYVPQQVTYRNKLCTAIRVQSILFINIKNEPWSGSSTYNEEENNEYFFTLIDSNEFKFSYENKAVYQTCLCGMEIYFECYCGHVCHILHCHMTCDKLCVGMSVISDFWTTQPISMGHTDTAYCTTALFLTSYIQLTKWELL